MLDSVSAAHRNQSRTSPYKYSWRWKNQGDVQFAVKPISDIVYPGVIVVISWLYLRSSKCQGMNIKLVPFKFQVVALFRLEAGPADTILISS